MYYNTTCIIIICAALICSYNEYFNFNISKFNDTK